MFRVSGTEKDEKNNVDVSMCLRRDPAPEGEGGIDSWKSISPPSGFRDAHVVTRTRGDRRGMALYIPDGAASRRLVPVAVGVVVGVRDTVDDDVGDVTVTSNLTNGGEGREKAGELAENHLVGSKRQKSG